MPRGPMGGRRAVEKPHDFGKVMGKLVNYCRNYLPVIIIALILGAAGTVCQIVGPDKLKDMTNEIVKGLPAIVNGRPVMNSVDFGTVGHIAWTLVALYVGYAVLGYVQSWMMANVTQRTAQRLRESISVKINKLPLKYFDKVSYGDVLSRITNDVDAIGQTLGRLADYLGDAVRGRAGDDVLQQRDHDPVRHRCQPHRPDHHDGHHEVLPEVLRPAADGAG